MNTETMTATVNNGNTAKALLIHMFEQKGLGKAPFRCIRVTTEGDNCQFCGTAICYRFYLRGMDGKEFYVGSDCVLKTNDEGLILYVQRELKRRMAEQRSTLILRKRAAVEAALMNPNTRAVLASKSHPKGWLGKTYLDYLEYFMSKDQRYSWVNDTLAKQYQVLVKDGTIEKLPRMTGKNAQGEE